MSTSALADAVRPKMSNVIGTSSRSSRSGQHADVAPHALALRITAAAGGKDRRRHALARLIGEAHVVELYFRKPSATASAAKLRRVDPDRVVVGVHPRASRSGRATARPATSCTDQAAACRAASSGSFATTMRAMAWMPCASSVSSRARTSRVRTQRFAPIAMAVGTADRRAGTRCRPSRPPRTR